MKALPKKQKVLAKAKRLPPNKFHEGKVYFSGYIGVRCNYAAHFFLTVYLY